MTDRYNVKIRIILVTLVLLWAMGLFMAPLARLVEESFVATDYTDYNKHATLVNETYKKSLIAKYKIKAYNRKLQYYAQHKKPQKVQYLEKQIQKQRAIYVKYKTKGDLLAKRHIDPKRFFTVKNYLNLLKIKAHGKILLKTLIYSALITILGVFLCYPIAYFLAKVIAVNTRGLFFLAITTPYFLTEILKGLAWRIIFNKHGLINSLLLHWKIIDAPISFLENHVGLAFGMVYVSALIIIVPMYNALQSVDDHMIEAARDLGASTPYTHIKIIIPSIKNGIAVSMIFAYLGMVGTYAIPAMLGGNTTLWYSELIYQYFGAAGEWGIGSAYAIILIVITMICVFSLKGVFKVNISKMVR